MNPVLNDADFVELRTILTDVCRDIAPLEEPAFDAARAVLSEEDVRSSDTPAPVTRALPGVIEAGLLSVHLLAGSLALIETYRTRKLREEEREFEYEIREEWQKALIAAGMSPELASLIPVKRSADMIRFLRIQLTATSTGGQSAHGSQRPGSDFNDQ